MDDLDRKITGLLQRNGRASNAYIARQVGVSEGTVRRRLKRLLQEGIIRIVGVPEPEQVGLDTEALVGIQADPDKLDQVASHVAALPQASLVSVVTGAFDVFAWVSLTSSEELGEFLRKRVGTIPGVRHTETFVSLGVRKRSYSVPLPPG